MRVKNAFEDQFNDFHEKKVSGGVVKTAFVLNEEGYSSCVYLRPAFNMTNNLDICKYKSLLGASSCFSRIKRAFNYKIFHPDIVSEIMNKFFSIKTSPDIYSILFVGEQKKRTNKIFKSYSELNVSDSEISIYKKQLKQFEQKMLPFIDEININYDFDKSWLWSAAHHSGAVSLDSGLVSEDYQLLGFDNIFVCDASLISEHNYFNTGLTIASMAMELADQNNPRDSKMRNWHTWC